MDVTLVMALRDLLEPESVAIYRTVGEVGQERWLTRAHLRAGDAWPRPTRCGPSPRRCRWSPRIPCAWRPCARGAVTQWPRRQWLYLFPLATDRDAVGVIEILSTRRLGTGAQRMVSSVLRIYRNFQGLLDYSERDTLTGLLNRKTFDESFLKVLSSCRPAAVSTTEDRRHEGGRATAGVIDIDHFKSVNDRFGHLIGDEVLLLLSR
jgi:hypothetical protein